MESYGQIIQRAEKDNHSRTVKVDASSFITTASSDGKNTCTVSDPTKEEWKLYDVSVPSVFESVNHPNHYNTGKIEVIDFIEDQNLNFHLGNAVKYICRAGKKDPSKLKEDLDKAIWYIERYKDNLK